MRKLIAASALLFGLWSSAYAHHSMNGFDRTKTVTVTGVVKQFKWANPHSWIEMDAPNDKGGVVTWNFEMTAPNILARGGWKSNLVKPGDKVTINARPLASGESGGGLFVSVTLPDGTTYTERGKQGPAAAK